MNDDMPSNDSPTTQPTDSIPDVSMEQLTEAGRNLNGYGTQEPATTQPASASPLTSDLQTTIGPHGSGRSAPKTDPKKLVHWFDENGVCVRCGYVDPTFKRDTTSTTVADSVDPGAVFQAQPAKANESGNAHWTSLNRQPGVTHVFDEYGVCIKCGYSMDDVERTAAQLRERVQQATARMTAEALRRKVELESKLRKVQRTAFRRFVAVGVFAIVAATVTTWFTSPIKPTTQPTTQPVEFDLPNN